MNSKQRRLDRRKFRYQVQLVVKSHNFFSDLVEKTTWMNKVKGDCQNKYGGLFVFSKEQDAIMFALKFSGTN